MALKQKKSAKKILIITIVLLILLLIILLLVQKGAIDYLKNLNKKPKLFIINDECSLIYSIIHKINNDGECKVVCANNCNFRKMKYQDSELIKSNNSCYICNCYCK